MSDDQPKVSIGLPVYNGETYLAVAIESLLAQTFMDFELIISDNASTDGTERICRECAVRDKRIRYARQEQNQGLAWNFNHTFDLARGRYFRWHAHDDSCAPTLLEHCVAALDADPDAVLCYPRVGIIDWRGEPLRNDPASWRPLRPDLPADAIEQRDLRGIDDPKASRRFGGVLMKTVWCLEPYGLIRTDAMRTTGKLRGYCAAEKVFIAEMALRGKLIEVPEVLLYARRHIKQYSMIATNTEQQGSVKPRRFKWRLPIPRHVRPTLGYLLLVPAAPIGSIERARCVGVVARYVLQVSKWKRIVVNTIRDIGLTDGYLHAPEPPSNVEDTPISEPRVPTAVAN